MAAHLDDLKAAKSHGFRTVYVERPLEERRPELRSEDIVDVWVKEDEEGFVTAAERLGVQILQVRRRSGSAPDRVETA